VITGIHTPDCERPIGSRLDKHFLFVELHLRPLQGLSRHHIKHFPLNHDLGRGHMCQKQTHHCKKYSHVKVKQNSRERVLKFHKIVCAQIECALNVGHFVINHPWQDFRKPK
jgi:hypothetical protein